MAVSFAALIVLAGVAVALLLFTLLFALLMRALRRGRGDRVSAEESRMMQEMYHGMTKLEERVEALETLLLNAEKERP